MEPSLEERIDAYLDGLLSREEARAVERDLAEKPEAARALTAALALREMLLSLPPTQSPKGLEQRIFEALPLRAAPVEPKEKESGTSLFPRVRAALSGATWGLRGPAILLSGASLSNLNEQPAITGMSQVRWALGPLGAPRPARVEPPKRPLWQRAIAYAWKKS